ncbi:MAG: hypothetical protein N2746_05215 [Deltaproteobacteria bacterium]|nr:hypothetical protein [Deltaproteobacteria bacterium]
MKALYIILLLTTTILVHCSVDYSILEDRFCNSQNQCIEGYRCDLKSGKCIKANDLSDIPSLDIKIIDIQITDIIHYDTEPEYDIKETTMDSITYDSNENYDNFNTGDTKYVDALSDVEICNAGNLICKDSNLYICDESNNLVLKEECKIGCKNDHCMECLPNEKICADDENIKICTQDGIYIKEKCSYKCFNNQCVVCLPSDKFCNDNRAIKCNPIGTEWEEIECTIGCSGGECMICEPEKEKKCINNDIYLCKPSGLEFVKMLNCCHDNNCVDGQCVITAPRVIDYDPKDWKVGSTVYWNIDGCFFVKDASKVFIDYGNEWKEITEYNNFTYIFRSETKIQIKVNVQTIIEYNFKVINPDGQSSQQYRIKKHY